MRIPSTIMSLSLAIMLAACIEGPEGPEGPAGPIGPEGPTGERGPRGEPGESPTPESVASALATEYPEVIRGPAMALQAVDGDGRVIGRVTGVESWLWNDELEGYLWAPVMRDGVLRFDPPPGLRIYNDADGCQIRSGYSPMIDPDHVGAVPPVDPMLLVSPTDGTVWRASVHGPTTSIWVHNLLHQGECTFVGTTQMDLHWSQEIPGAELLPHTPPLRLEPVPLD